MSDDDDRELLQLYQDNVNGNADIDEARDAFEGRFNSEAEWAAEWLDSTGSLEEVPDYLRNYIDFVAYARDARISGDITFVRHNGDVWVFHTV